MSFRRWGSSQIQWGISIAYLPQVRFLRRQNQHHPDALEMTRGRERFSRSEPLLPSPLTEHHHPSLE